MTIILQPTAGSVPLTSLLPFVLPKATSCPDDVALFNLLQATIEFCQRTTVWREEQGEIFTLADTTSYEFQLEGDRRVHKLLQLTLDGREIDTVDPEQGRRLDSVDAIGPYAYGALGMFELRPAQAEDLSIVTYSALMPTQVATTIPADFERFFDALADGALARMFETPGVDWTNEAAAARHRYAFNDRIYSVARAVKRGHAKVRRDRSTRFY